jgi:hypothetical protein
LPSDRKKALGKGPFAGRRFAGSPLPRGALGKAFAESKQVFAECFWHSAKPACPVVTVA